MRKIIRFFYKQLLPKRMRQSIDLFHNLRVSDIESVKEKKILVISPHPDDDVVGCGGLIHKCYLSGAEIVSVYMTDGRKGNSKFNEDELVSVRKEESKRAAKIIGIKKCLFLDNKDGELALSRKTVDELSVIINDLKPEAVFLPFLIDNHNDHMMTNRIFLEASVSLPSIMCYTWGLWSSLPGVNLMVDITKYIDVKREAIEQFKSQIKMSDLVEASLGISKYYSMFIGEESKGKWAELFCACSLAEYRRLASVIDWN